uniref:Uncharacterized protein n=1 Tax=Rhizophora mucronata TaxID=61149 RepID=A0A2P2KDQ8_RHIMU
MPSPHIIQTIDQPSSSKCNTNNEKEYLAKSLESHVCQHSIDTSYQPDFIMSLNKHPY